MCTYPVQFFLFFFFFFSFLLEVELFKNAKNLVHVKNIVSKFVHTNYNTIIIIEKLLFISVYVSVCAWKFFCCEVFGDTMYVIVYTVLIHQCISVTQ